VIPDWLDVPWGELRATAAVAIFVATYTVMAVGKLPGFHLDRAGAALLGAALMVATGIMSLEDAYRAVDLDTIVLLLGMMIVAANLRLSGFFRLVTAWAVTRAHRPLPLLAAIVLAAGVLSAFLVNDAICLVMAPLVIELTRALRRDPVPYLLAVAMAANAGSVATITGNPQNMIVGNLSGIPYADFAAALAPLAGLALLLTVMFVALGNPREILDRERLAASHPRVRVHRRLALKSVLVTAAMVAAFFLGVPVAEVAILGGGVLLLTRSVKARKVYAHIDWPLLVMFAGLFVVVAGFQRAMLTPELLTQARLLMPGGDVGLAGATALLSNLVSNVPAVLLLQPLADAAADPAHAWLVVAMASTFAGNLTLVGSVANLIVVQSAAASGIRVGFWRHLVVGVPLTVATLAVGVAWLGAG
jgi:Na+/H+ antiporter NhaD/arsenite permease-like protein